MDEDMMNMNNGKKPADPKSQGSLKGNKDWGKGRGRADAEEKGRRDDEAPKGGHGLGKGRGRADDGEDTVAAE